jgi:hypothetical protein
LNIKGAGDAAAAIKLIESPTYTSIEQAAHASYKDENAKIAGEGHAIAYSPWNDPNQPGSATRPQYERNIVGGALNALVQDKLSGSVVPPASGQPGPTFTTPGFPLPGIAGSITSWAESKAVRVSEVVAGAVLIAIGIVMLGKAVAVGTAQPARGSQFTGAARTVTP